MGKQEASLLYAQLLEHMRKLVHISVPDEAKICAAFEPRYVRKKQFILQAGQVAYHENFLCRGCTATYYTGSDFNLHVVQLAIEDKWVGDPRSFYNQVPSQYTIEAVEDTTLLSIRAELMEQLYAQVPALERLMRIKLQNAYNVFNERIVALNSHPAKQRYEDFAKRYPEYDRRVPQQYIASYLGMRPEYLSRLRSRRAG
jgi:CRP-like cAMP-binding protein